MGLSVVDGRAGTLVWVQRKNGSWWPGRVLELNQLSSPSHPSIHRRRAGTPIQLLGREDATVDWYNIEKSKRIKAFRCGEFDGCIERAESSQASFPKKFVKYVRREGAILHALELEKQQMQKKHKAAGKEQAGIICRGKRSRRVYLPADSNNCWKRTAFASESLQVSSSNFEVHECLQQSGSAENHELPRSMESDPSEKDSRGPDTVGRERQLPDAAILASPRLSNSGKFDGQPINMNGKWNCEHNRSSNFPPNHLTAPVFGVRKWEVKGKENICNLTRRQGDVVGVKRSVKLKKGIANSSCQSTPRGSFLEEPDTQCSDPVDTDFCNVTETTLTNVELTVQASYPRERVPLVSLMSKLNGKAIVGHLVDVEALDDGSSDILLANNQEIGHKLFGNDGSTTFPPAWRTYRRTPVSYVARSHPPVPKDYKNAQANQNPDKSCLKAREKILPPKKEFLRKSLKKPSLSNQKTRTLSRFDTEMRHSGNGDDVMDGLLKAKDSLPARVTCVPVKQIYSKLLTAVGGVQS